MTRPLPEFRIVRPLDLSEAIAIRRSHPNSRFIAGGTDLLVQLRHGSGGEPDLLIDLTSIDELSEIQRKNGTMTIGALATVATVASIHTLDIHHHALSQAAAAIAGPGHRAMGTLGGNLCLDTRCIYYNQSEWWRQANGFCLKQGGSICHVAPQGSRCHAAYAGDLAPALLALGAEVEIAAAERRRSMPLQDLFSEDGRAHLKLADDELVAAVHLPSDPPPSAYRKVRIRAAIDFPLAGVAVALAAPNGIATSLRIGISGTNSRPFLLEGTDALIGRPVDDRLLNQVEKLVQRQVRPMRTTLASAQYRRLAAAAAAVRLIASLATEQCNANGRARPGYLG